MISLKDGFLLCVNGQDYFIQARLILHLYDTPALLKTINMQGINSYSGCPFCSVGKGCRRIHLGICAIVGARCLLDTHHYLRKFGYSKQCCPAQYYTYKPTKEQLKSNQEHPVHFKPYALQNKPYVWFLPRQLNQEEDISSLVPCLNEPNATISVRDFLLSPAPFVWYHNDRIGDSNTFVHDFELLKDSLYSHHADYRPQKFYNRRSDHWYKSTNEERKRLHLYEYNGVKGLWVFAKLSYADFGSQICWDVFHTVKNIMTNILLLLSSERTFSSTTLSAATVYCKETMTFPSIILGQPDPWVLSTDEIKKIEATFNCLWIPTNLSEEFQVNFLFTRKGMLRGVTNFRILSSLMRLLLAETHLTEGIKVFLRMLSDDITDLYRPQFSRTENDDLYYRVAETLAVHELIFGEKECSIKWHQLLDIVHFRPFFGPVRGWWTLSGERANGAFKDLMNNGGSSYDITVLNRYESLECTRIHDAYSFDNSNFQSFHLIRDSKKRSMQESINGKDWMYLDDRNKMCYNEQLSSLFNGFGSVRLSDYEYEVLFEALVLLVNRETPSKQDAENSSTLVLLYNTWDQFYLNQNSIKKKDKVEYFSFKDWLAVLQVKPMNKLYLSAKLSDTRREEIIKKSGFLLKEISSDEFITGYEDILVKGVKFNGRGFHCRESQRPNTERGKNCGPLNSLNILNSNWSKRADLNSWFKFRNSRISNKTVQCGQLNCAFYIRLPSEEIIDGSSFASVVARKHAFSSDQLWAVSIDDNVSFQARLLFVNFADIIASNILIVGKDSSNRPKKLKFLDPEEKILMKYYSPYNEEIIKLILIEAHPERNNL
jgi:hypothetical protein